LQGQVEVVVVSTQIFVIDKQGIVDKLPDKEEFFIRAQCANSLGLVGQPHANGPINESLDTCRRCGKLIRLKDLKV
jgi:hypothetical protein